MLEEVPRVHIEEANEQLQIWHYGRLQYNINKVLYCGSTGINPDYLLARIFADDYQLLLDFILQLRADGKL